MGLPPRLLAPGGWGELASDLGSGVSGALGDHVPVQRRRLSGPPRDPVRRAAHRRARRLARVLRRARIGDPAPGRWSRWSAVSRSRAQPSRRPTRSLGLVLFAGIAAWLWLGRIGEDGAVPRLRSWSRAPRSPCRLRRRSTATARCSTTGAGTSARPPTRSRSLLVGPHLRAARLVAYRQDADDVTARAPSTGGPRCWSASTAFAGSAAGGSTSARYELPEPAARALSVEDRIAELNPRWVHRPTFHIDELSSPLLVAPGAVLLLPGLTIASGGPSGLTLPPDDEPSPPATPTRSPPTSPTPPRAAPRRPRAPRPRPPPVHPDRPSTDPVRAGPNRPFRRPLQARHPAAADRQPAHDGRAAVRGRGRRARPADPRRLGLRAGLPARPPASPQGTAGELRRRRGDRALSAHAATPTASRRRGRELPLRAFLFRDRVGYCQQFSGAMALMLRMVGIPARVAAGFSPGTPQPERHRMRWSATSTPTPGSRSTSTASAGSRSTRRPRRRPPPPSPAAWACPRARQRTHQPASQRGGPIPLDQRRPQAVAGGGTPWLAIAAVLGVAIAAAWGVSVARRRRGFLALPPDEGARAQARELGALVGHLGLDRSAGVTLLDLERRLATIAGPAAGAYPRALRLARFAPDGDGPPTLRDRRDLRRALYGKGRSRRWLAGIRAIPPGAPR